MAQYAKPIVGRVYMADYASLIRPTALAGRTSQFGRTPCAARPPSLLPFPLGRRRCCCWRCRRRRCSIAVARAEQQAGRVTVEIVHRAADIAEGAAAVGHQKTRSLVEI